MNMLHKNNYTKDLLITDLVIGFVIALGYNQAVSPKSLLEGLIISMVIFLVSLLFLTLEERNK